MKNTLRPHQSRAYDSMSQHDYGQIVIPTGGGKTYIMIADCLRRLSSSDETRTIVVVAPRILLANQLSDEFESVVDYVNIAHVHSGETHHFSTTNCHELSVWHNNTVRHRMIFTTYHSLHRVLDLSLIHI